MVLCDVPIAAYMTWGISCFVVSKEKVERDYDAEQWIESKLKAYPYSKEHNHIGGKCND